MLKFKHFPSMPSALEELFWGDPDSKDLRLLLPLAFAEWLEIFGGTAGLVTLVSESDPGALEEAASWGYEEEGFFYSFLSKGSEIRRKLELSNSPFYLKRSGGMDLYRSRSVGCILSPIHIGLKLAGFFLVEIDAEPGDRQVLLLGLFCQKISWVLNRKNSPKTKHQDHDSYRLALGDVLFRLSGAGPEQLDRFRRRQMICIRGQASSGKKTVAKWIHKQDLQEKPLVIVSVLPEQIPKLEKTLADWEKMAQAGTLVLEKVEEYSLNQQRILYEYSQRKAVKCRLIFLENIDKKPAEEFVYFRSLLDGNSIQLPAWKHWTREERKSAILPIFEEVCEVHGRPDLKFSEEALESLVGGSSYQNLEDIRNAIEDAVLNSGTAEIRNSELKKEGARGVSLPDPEDLDLRKAVEAVERQKILLADKLFGGNQIRMAKALGISRGSLQYKLRNLGLG